MPLRGVASTARPTCQLGAQMNHVDRIATHFYEQGKADAVKDVVNKSKNLSDVKARQGNTGEVFVGGFKVKSISGADSTKLKIKTKKFN